jgi:TPR repeat protein
MVSRSWVWICGALVGCSQAGPSRAPLSAPNESASATTQSASPAPNATTQASGAAPRTGGVGATGGTKSSKQGKRALLQRSCDLGSGLACNELALSFGDDLKRELPLLERACDLGLPRGCANWGALVWRSTPSDADRERALGLMDRACEASDEYACASLGDALYESGQAHFGKAHVAYEKGCKLSSSDACVSDGWMLRRGEGATKDARRARELFRLACDHQSYNGCAALGYDLTDDPKTGEELAEGARLLKLACEHDEAFGCFSLGLRILTRGGGGGGGGGGTSLDQGLAFLKRSCSLGLSNACDYAANVEAQLKNQGPPAADDEVP